MSDLASTSRSKLRYVKETNWNVTPASAMQEVTFTGESLQYAIATTTSNEIRADRQITDLVQTSAESAGGIDFEMRSTATNDFMEAALFGQWSTLVAISGSDIAAATTGNKYTSTTTDFTTKNLNVGQWINVSGFSTAGNNGYAKVVSFTATNLVVSGLTLTTESSGATIAMKGKMLRNGVKETSFTLETEMTDITEFMWYSGMQVSSMSLEVATGAIVTQNFGFMGAKHGSAQTTRGTGSPIAAVTGAIYNGVNNVSAIREGGSPIAAGIYIQKLSLALDNGLRGQPAIGNLAPIGIGNSRCNVTGSIDVYYANDTLYQKFINATGTSISYRISDVTGNTYVITIPNIKFTSGVPNISGADADVVLPLAFQALRDVSTDCTIQIDFIAA